MDHGSWIMDHGSWIMDHGSWIMDLGSWIMDHGSWIMYHGSWILDHGSWIMDHESWILDHGSWILDHGSWILDHGSWILDHGIHQTYIRHPQWVNCIPRRSWAVSVFNILCKYVGEIEIHARYLNARETAPVPHAAGRELNRCKDVAAVFISVNITFCMNMSHWTNNCESKSDEFSNLDFNL